MKVKKVFRYYCEYCKKAGCSKFHLQRHEDHCTKNPHRKCRMCEQLGNAPEPISELLSLIPEIDQFARIINHDFELSGNDAYDETVYEIPESIQLEIIEKLREKTGGCPACMLATIRQKNIPLYAIDKFNYKKEVESFWHSVNQDRERYY